MKDCKIETIEINEGYCFILPAGIPHKPIRAKNSIGIVIESTRRDGFKGTKFRKTKRITSNYLDSLVWLCPQCDVILHKVDFKINRIDRDIEAAIHTFESNNREIYCPNCSLFFKLSE